MYTILSKGCVGDTSSSVQQIYKKFQTFLMSDISRDSFILFGQQFLKELESLNTDEPDLHTEESIEVFHTDISDSAVQSRRKDFHSLVPLFFADNTPMLYRVFEKYGDTICLLEINKDVVGLEDVKFSNGNLASEETEIHGSLEGFTNEEWEVIYSRQPAYWQKWKRTRSAEVLVPFKVPVKYIKSVSVARDSIMSNAQALVSVMIAKLDIPVNNNLSSSGVC